MDNMLLDSYLVQKSNENYLRIYRWKNPTLSLGLTNNVSELNLEYIRNSNIDIVRRETGGGVVFHNQDLCFSLITNSSLKPKENYLAIKNIIEKIFFDLGKIVTETKDKNIKSTVCFEGSNSHEISIEGNKIVGMAQKKIDKRYLLQGSIQLKSVQLSELLIDNREIVQYGLDSNLNFNEIKEIIYNNFATIRELRDVSVDKIINSAEYLAFRKENINKFYEEI